MGIGQFVSTLSRHPVNYRSIADLNTDILAGLSRIPRPVDLVVGIPRSGMLAASMLALHLNCALTDVDGFLNGRLMNCGQSRKGLYQSIGAPAEAKRVIVLDDSVYTGGQIDAIRRQFVNIGAGREIIFAAVYVLPESAARVDFYFRILPPPRMFEWNLMHHPELRNACIDMDGVLCCDPTEAENDDGPNYRRFLAETKPYLLPTVPVGCIVTCRLEKYRAETEAWLFRHEVKYGKLVMMNLPDKAARIKAGRHGAFKAGVCREVGATLFIESEENQALEIAAEACVDVFCVRTGSFFRPSAAREKLEQIRRTPKRFRTLVRKALGVGRG